MLATLLLALLAQSDPEWDGTRDSPVISSCPLTDANCESRPVTTVRASSAWWQRLDGGVSVADAGFGRYDPNRGLLSYAAETNAVPGAFSAWSVTHVNLSDGGVTTNPAVGAVGSCPYPDPMGGAGAVKVDWPAVSDLGASPTGLSILFKGYTSTAATWTDSVWVRACDETDGGTLYESDGNIAGNQSLSVGATWEVRSRTSTKPGVSGEVAYGPRPGFSEPATQPALCACLWAPKAALGSVAGPPIVCGAASCATVADAHTIPTSGWPTTSGEIEFSFTPMWSSVPPNGIAVGLLDTRTGTNGVYLYLSSSGGPLLLIGNASGSTALAQGIVPTFTENVAVRFLIRWGGGNAWVYANGTLSASQVDGLVKMPTAHAATVTLGGVGTASAKGWVKLLQVSR